MKSLKMAKKPVINWPSETEQTQCPNGDTFGRVRVEFSGYYVSYESHVESIEEQFRPLENDRMEQMIEEMLDYGSIELCFAMGD